MESPGSDSVNCGVGSIVWVRRRNGSWWPGKILGPDELSSSHLTSPRSGTPVKLLGREDASVHDLQVQLRDWYNLEKSKRVKAFRCGEFDDCIERAESSQGMPIKKREKYARREDAILHALELEKQMFKQQGKVSLPVCRTNSKSNAGMRKGSHPSSEHLKNDNVKVGNSKLRQLSKRLDAIEGTEIDVSHASPKMKEAILFSGEDDHSVEPRMRGLQDFGLKISSTKRKFSTSAASDCSKKVGNDSNAPSHSPMGHSIGSDANGDEQMGVVCRARRTKCMYLPESSDSLEYKEYIPSQIEMSASQFGTGSSHSYPGSLIEENVSGVSEDGGSDSSGSDSSDSETDSDSSRTVRDVDNEMEIFSDGVIPTEMQPNTFGRSEVPEHTSMSEGEPDNSGVSGDMYDLDPIYPGYANESVSKWKLKGKRNSRNLAKRSADGADPQVRLGPKASGKSPGFNRNYYFNDTSAETNMGVDDFKSRIKLEDGYYLTPRSVTKAGNAISCNVTDWDDMTWHDRSSLQGYWDAKREPCGPLYDPPHLFGGRSRSILVEVDLTVQASYRKEPVPIVSLMSKLNGRAIIGHPIQIETLEDGFTDTLSYAPVDSDGSTKLPPAWRTARRTANSRVPRPHLSSAHDGHEAVYDYSLVGGGESKLLFKKSFSNHRGSLGRSIQRVSQSPDDRKFLKKTKKVSLSSSQKTRTLSSIAVGQNISSKPIHSSNSSLVDGLIKPESSSGPATVACIPVKLVFSRLMEKINRPASKASTYMPLLNNDSDKNPL